MNALTRSEAADRALTLERECAAKLIVWRREAAAASVQGVKAALGLTPVVPAASHGENIPRAPEDPAALAPPPCASA